MPADFSFLQQVWCAVVHVSAAQAVSGRSAARTTSWYLEYLGSKKTKTCDLHTLSVHCVQSLMHIVSSEYFQSLQMSAEMSYASFGDGVVVLFFRLPVPAVPRLCLWGSLARMAHQCPPQVCVFNYWFSYFENGSRKLFVFSLRIQWIFLCMKSDMVYCLPGWMAYLISFHSSCLYCAFCKHWSLGYPFLFTDVLSLCVSECRLLHSFIAWCM